MNTYSIHEKAHAYAHTKPRLTEFVFSAPKIVLTPVSKHPHPLHTDPQPKLNQYPHTTRPRKNRQLLPVDERFWRQASMFLWWPPSRTFGIRYFLFWYINDSGRVYISPLAMRESSRDSPLPSTPSMLRETASMIASAGSSPPVSTYGPTDISSALSIFFTRPSMPS